MKVSEIPDVNYMTIDADQSKYPFFYTIVR